MFKLLALICLIVGFIAACVDPKTEWIMPVLEWFVLGIGLALLSGLNSETARKL